MLTIYSAINFLAAIVMVTFAVVVYSGAKNSETRVYAVYSLFTGLWGLAIGMALFFQEPNDVYVTQSIRASYWLGLGTAILFHYFSRIHRDDPLKHRVWKWLSVALCGIFLFVFQFTNTVLIKMSFGEYAYERIPTYNWIGFILFNVIFSSLLTAGFWNLYKKWRGGGLPEDIARTFFIMSCALFAYAPPVVFAVTMPLIGNFRFFWIAPFITSIWVIAMTYGIAKRGIFKPRIVTAQLLVVMMLIILFVNIFVP